MTRANARLLASLLLLASAAGCSALAGVDFDQVHSADELDGATETGTNPGDDTDGGAGDGDVSMLADGAAPPSTCTPASNAIVCQGKCGAVTDNCGNPRTCSSDCGLGKSCQAGMCACVPDPAWCNGRCGASQDNCNQGVSCGGCDGGLTCSAAGACGCVPEPAATTCAGKACGTATNNCGQSVGCGNGSACANMAAVCESNGTCCVDDGAACVNRCAGVSVVNNCGQNVGCAVQCNAGQVCVGTSCCVPEPFATTCAGKACGPATNNCGQAVACSDTCAAPSSCGGGGAGPNACGCTPDNPCTTMCGAVTNRCGTPVTCGGCVERCPCRGGSCNATTHYCSCNVGGPCF